MGTMGGGLERQVIALCFAGIKHSSVLWEGAFAWLASSVFRDAPCFPTHGEQQCCVLVLLVDSYSSMSAGLRRANFVGGLGFVTVAVIGVD